MRKVIIADTGCLILLDKIEELDILHKLFSKVTTTNHIANEFKKELPNWISVESPANKVYQQIVEASLDKGEASAIACAIEQGNSLLIMDDLKGRRYAERLGLMVTGVLGILIEGKLSGHIQSIKPALTKIKQADFKLAPELEKMAISKSQEE
jgi:predicted nucleic acid-binding protein